MIKCAIPAVFLCLAGCNTPSLGFRGVDPVTVVVDGSTFDVRVNEFKAEAIRTNMQYAPRLGPMGARASAAIEQVSGCSVSRIRGDQAVIVADLNCGKGSPKPTPIPQDFECYSIGGLDVTGDDFDNLVLDCSSTKRY